MFVESFTPEEQFEARMSQNDVTYNFWFVSPKNFNIEGYATVDAPEEDRHHFLHFGDNYYCVIKSHVAHLFYLYGVNFFINLTYDEYTSIRMGGTIFVMDKFSGQKRKIIVNPEAPNVS